MTARPATVPGWPAMFWCCAAKGIEIPSQTSRRPEIVLDLMLLILFFFQN
jgi:hypothetical protein